MTDEKARKKSLMRDLLCKKVFENVNKGNPLTQEQYNLIEHITHNKVIFNNFNTNNPLNILTLNYVNSYTMELLKEI